MTLEHTRADAAFRVREGLPANEQAEFDKLVPGLGAEVQRCGLLQAVAFLKRSPSRAVADKIGQAVLQHLVGTGMMPPVPKGTDLLQALRGTDTTRYIIVTREVLALSVWLKRAAQ